MAEVSSLSAITPLDGRYRSQLNDVAEFFSEQALIKARVNVEVEYVIFLAEQGVAPTLNKEQIASLRQLVTEFSEKEAAEVKVIEAKIRHDVKAVEYFLQDSFKNLKVDQTAWIHFGLTSEDVNSLAVSLMLKQGIAEVVMPALNDLITDLQQKVQAYETTVMLARTHGQPAVPTTFGKEFLVFQIRLQQELGNLQIAHSQIAGKLNGAVGNYNALQVAKPEHDWLELSQAFVHSLGLQPALVTTQTLPADSYIKVFQSLQLINTILTDLSQDMWRYISDGYLVQAVSKEQVGSSTMPHKVNPIDFENAEGNLGLANALLGFFVSKLPISRLQRDLSDSTVKRNFGLAIGYSVLAYQNCLKGLKKVKVDEKRLEADLDSHWEILTEAIQTMLRTTGDETAYDRLKELSRGQAVTAEILSEFIDTLSLSEEQKNRLKNLSPQTYTGLTEQIINKFTTRVE